LRVTSVQTAMYERIIICATARVSMWKFRKMHSRSLF